METIDTALKAATVLLGAIGTLKLVHDWIYVRPSRLREDYHFAKMFLSEAQKGDMHAYLRTKGYQALAGSTSLTAGEVEYALKLSNPDQSLRNYAYCKKYLQHTPTAGEKQITFKSKYATPWSRKWRAWAYLTMYFIAYMAAFSPLLLPASWVGAGTGRFAYFIAALPIFLPLAFLALNAGVRVNKASEFVKEVLG